RLDAPVRGNGKIIQELEGIFRGAGWNVIKTIWGSGCDPLIARESTGLLLKRMEEAVDGQHQAFKTKDGADGREKFFGKYPEPAAVGGHLGGTPGRQISTTMAFVRILNTLLRDKAIGPRVVPIVPDESRTFGMEGMFRQFGIFSQAGQLYQPEDANQLMYYREAPDGQMLQEGINEAGGMASWIAAATAYSTSDIAMIPFYIFYSMFGFQRVMDLIWAAGDSRARGFLLGGTAGRTTLNGEGLQHEDGHSHVLASVVPNCVAYDPTYSYEVAVIVAGGLRRMFAEQEDVFFYLTLMNENYEHPA